MSKSNDIDPFFEKGLPISLEAERSILGGILLENNLLYQATERMNREDFGLESHRIILDVMQALSMKDSPIDMVTISEELRRISKFENVGGARYISSLIDGVPRTDTVEPYIKIVLAKSILRKLIKAGNNIVAQAFDEEDEPETVLETAESLIFGISSQIKRAKEAQHVSVIGGRLADFYERKVQDGDSLLGVDTGYLDLNDRIGGLPPGITIVAGRPGHAKTAFAVSIACNIARNGGRVYFLSVESVADQIVQRVLASESRIDSTRMRRGYMDGDEWRRLADTLLDLTTTKFYVDDDEATSPDMLVSRVKQFILIHGGLDLLVVDNVQLMARYMTDGRRFKDLKDAISYVGTRLIGIGKLNVPILLLTQTNRDIDTRPGHRPVLSDLAESANLERDAEIVINIVRPELYKDVDDERLRGIAKLYFLKNREATMMDVDFDMAFIDKYTRFEQLSRDYK